MDDSFDNWLKERAPEADADDGRLSPGTVIGAYRVESFLGKGGFAEVYSAKSANGERVAIKILHRLDEQSRMRFERESNILSQIHHSNIPKLLSFGSCGDRPYLVMEMLTAKELPQTDEAVASFVTAVCRAADALHRMGYVHRDIKPSNVLWRGDTPVLIDFGLACFKTDVPRLPSTISIVDGQRIVVGTMGYAAPEQFAGGTIDETTDVHAIGMLADACFNGKSPRCWRKVIDRATNSRGHIRYRTALVMARKISLRHFGRDASVVLGLAVLAGLVLLIWHGRNRIRQARDLKAMRPIEVFHTQEVYRVVETPAVARTQEVFQIVTVTNAVSAREAQSAFVTNNIPMERSLSSPKPEKAANEQHRRDPIFEDVFGL